MTQRNLHCFTRHMDVMSVTAMTLKTWEARYEFCLWQTRWRKQSLLHRILAHMDGQFSTSKGTLFEVYFSRFWICFLTSDWKDSRLFSNVLFSNHDCEPYMSTGKAKHSAMLSNPWSWPWEKKAAQALFTLSTTEFLLEGAESHHTPKHYIISLLGGRFHQLRCWMPWVACLMRVKRISLDNWLWTTDSFTKSRGLGEGVSCSNLLYGIHQVLSTWADVICIGKASQKETIHA